MSKVLAVIPARGGSKGLSRKNIRPLCGKPMIAYTIEAALSVSAIDRVVVSTESVEIAEIAKEYGAEVPFLRPEELAKDETPGIDPVIYTCQTMEKICKEEYEYILLLQPTSPLRTKKHIEEAIEIFLRRKESFDSLVSVVLLEHPVEWNRRIGLQGKLEDFIPYSKQEIYARQKAEGLYRLNGAVYIAKKGDLYKARSFETERTLAYVMDRRSSVDIDTLEDFEYAEFLLEREEVLIGDLD